MSHKKLIKEEHFGIARKIVSNMTAESWETIPHAVVSYEPEATQLLKVIDEINEGRAKEERLTINTVMLRVIVEGLKACPALNAHLEFNRKLVRGCVKTYENIDVSMPMILKTGEMMTINMHNMQDKTITEMRDAIADSTRRANNSDMNEVMFEVSLDNTLSGIFVFATQHPCFVTLTEKYMTPHSYYESLTVCKGCYHCRQQRKISVRPFSSNIGIL